MEDKYVVTLEISRKWTEVENDEAAQFAYHKYRSKLVHGMVDALDVEVRNWQDLDDTRSHEVVEIILVLGPPLIGAAVEVWKWWVNRNMVKSVEFVKSDGTRLSIGEASLENITKVMKEFPKAA